MAGGFFSGGSSDAVNASVAEAEAAARAAEAARDEINNKFVEYTGQTEEGSYTVPNADDTLTTKFLNQEGNWVVPAGIDDVASLDDLDDVNIVNPSTGEFLTYNEVTGQWGNEEIDPADPITGGTGITVVGNEVSITDSGVGTDQLADDAVTEAKVIDGAISSLKIAPSAVTTNRIADSAVNATKLSVAGTDGQLLSTNIDGDLAWVTPTEGTAYTGSDGITLTGVDFTLTDSGVTTAKLNDNAVDADKLNVTGDGTAGQVLSSDGDGSFTWIDEGAGEAYTAGTGLDLTGQEFSIANGGVDTAQIAADAVDGGKLDATNTPTAGQFLTANLDNTFTWVTPAAGTAYTAGTGLDLTGDEFSISDGGVDSTQMADNSVGADQLHVTGDGSTGQFLASDGDGSFSWTASTNSLEGLTDTNIPAGGPSVRSFLEYNTTDGTWDSTAATEFLNISELFDVEISAPTNNQFLRYKTADGRWENESIEIPNGLSGGTGISIDSDVINIEDGGVDTTQLANSAVTNNKLADGAVNTSKIFDGAITTSKLGSGSVTAVKLGAIPISTLSDVNTAGVNNGQILTWDGTMWLPTNNNGGGGNSDNSRLGITIDPTSINQGEEDMTVTITLAIVDAASDTETISGQSVTVTDPLGHTVDVSGSGNSWTFNASATNAGNFVIRGHATFTLSGTASVHTASVNLPVHATNTNWYIDTTVTQPTVVTTMMDQGAYVSPEDVTYTANGGTRLAYVALPIRSGFTNQEDAYNIQTGVLFADLTDLGTISTNYTLFRLNDFNDVTSGLTLSFTITEA